MKKTVIRNGKSSYPEKYGMLVVLAGVILIFHLLSSSFLTAQNFSNILINEAVIGCLALGASFILIVDEFDLSLGYILCFCMVLGAYLAGEGCNGVVIVLAMVFAGACCGTVNGVIVTKLKVNAFIATMSVGLTLAGITQALSGGRILNSNIPDFIIWFSRQKVCYIGYCVIFVLILSIILSIILNHTVFGRQLYAVGMSKSTALYAGIQVEKIRIMAFVFAGMFCGIAAVLMLGQLGAASSAYGTSLLLPAYSIVFLSKASFSPGKINIPGMLVGLLLCAVGENGVEIIGAPTWGSYVFQGSVLIVSIWISIALTDRAEKKER